LPGACRIKVADAAAIWDGCRMGAMIAFIQDSIKYAFRHMKSAVVDRIITTYP
jgi:hypothetical protein